MSINLLFRNAIALITLSMLLGGCFDVQQSVKVDSKQIEYTRIFRFDAKLPSIGGKEDKEKFSCAKFITKPKHEFISLELTESNDGSNVICKGKYTAPYSAEGLAKISESLNDNPSKGKDSSDINESFQLKLDDLGRGKYRFTQSIDIRNNQGKKKEAENTQSAEIGDKFLQMMFAGRNLSWTFVAPKIISTNGKIAEDGKTATWEFPVANAMNTLQSFTVEFMAPLPWYMSIWYGILDFLDSIFSSTK